mmetsp:Transcript_95366/g.269901  ORF Transcript_95366/g.269901 Transcript_95366/m.269901 type:complete len:764 (-) Transcript_95366:34-2325(-)
MPDRKCCMERGWPPPEVIEQFANVVRGHWSDSMGNHVVVTENHITIGPPMTAAMRPVKRRPDTPCRDKVLAIWPTSARRWRCGIAELESIDEGCQRLVWSTQDGRKSYWSRLSADDWWVDAVGQFRGGSVAQPRALPSSDGTQCAPTADDGVPATNANALPDDTGTGWADHRFFKLMKGHWRDSMGNRIFVSEAWRTDVLTATLRPLANNPIEPSADDKTLMIWLGDNGMWRCGNATLALADDEKESLTWIFENGRRSTWKRVSADDFWKESGEVAFPWLLQASNAGSGYSGDMPADVLFDGARVAALLDIRQMIGADNEVQERITHMLMDYDLATRWGDYLIPHAESPHWQLLPIPRSLHYRIADRIHKIKHDAHTHRLSWSGDQQVLVGHHRISVRARDVEVLNSRWVLPPEDTSRPLEISRLLAMYSIFDNPLSNRRSGVHLGIDPALRRQCDYELFASPLNAAVPSGCFASKWPHLEWRFGSMGAYPDVIPRIPANAVVCVNPPFTDAYLRDVMGRLPELQERFRLRAAIPIKSASWRDRLTSLLPSATILQNYYDASEDCYIDLLHPTLLWEDPRCPPWTPSAASEPNLGLWRPACTDRLWRPPARAANDDGACKNPTAALLRANKLRFRCKQPPQQSDRPPDADDGGAQHDDHSVMSPESTGIDFENSSTDTADEDDSSSSRASSTSGAVAASTSAPTPNEDSPARATCAVARCRHRALYRHRPHMYTNAVKLAFFSPLAFSRQLMWSTCGHRAGIP